MRCPNNGPVTEADLAWHVRAWGRWVLARARRELATYYPTYADFQPLTPDVDFEAQPMRLLDTDEDGLPLLDLLNAAFDAVYTCGTPATRAGSPSRPSPTSGRAPSDASSAEPRCPCSRRAGYARRTASACC